jgi:hypothetical protein
MAVNAPLSDTAIANFAASTLDEQHITNFDGSSSLARFMAAHYSYARDELIRAHPWNFAKARALVAADAQAPAYGYLYRYRTPDDCLRVLPLRQDGYHEGGTPTFEYESGFILCDIAGPLKLPYLRRVTNPAEFDVLFARALGDRLAVLAAQRITGKSSYLEKAVALFNDTMALAVHVNSLESGKPEKVHVDGVTSGLNALNVRGRGF